MLVLDHDPGIGGRSSALSLVGLLPAAIAGRDVARMRGGEHQVLHATLSARHPEASAPAVGAAVGIGLWREEAIRNTAQMPASHRTAELRTFDRQPWAAN